MRFIILAVLGFALGAATTHSYMQSHIPDFEWFQQQQEQEQKRFERETRRQQYDTYKTYGYFERFDMESGRLVISHTDAYDLRRRSAVEVRVDEHTRLYRSDWHNLAAGQSTVDERTLAKLAPGEEVSVEYRVRDGAFYADKINIQVR